MISMSTFGDGTIEEYVFEELRYMVEQRYGKDIWDLSKEEMLEVVHILLKIAEYISED